MRLIVITHRVRASRLIRSSTMVIGFIIGGIFSDILFAAPLLRCQINRGAESRLLEFSPVSDPYSVKAVDISGGFRFKAVVVGGDSKIDYIKLYTYYESKRQAVLLHEAKYLAPVAQANPSSADLTGLNYVYSPRLERELLYSCALFEVTP